MARLAVCAWAIPLVASTAAAQAVRPGTLELTLEPGETAAVVWLVEDISEPLFGYSLEIQLSDRGGGLRPLGELPRIDPDGSSFLPSRNLFTAAGVDLDPTFSVIQPSGASGVLLNAIADDGSAVLPIEGVNDALGETLIEAGAAPGLYEFVIGPVSALSDADGFPVAFEPQLLTVRVVPLVPTLTPLALTAGWISRRRG